MSTTGPPADVLEVLRKRALLEAMRAADDLAHIDDADPVAAQLALKRMRTAIEDQNAMDDPDPVKATLARLAAAEVDWVSGEDGYSIGTSHENLDELENRIDLQRQLIFIREGAQA